MAGRSRGAKRRAGRRGRSRGAAVAGGAWGADRWEQRSRPWPAAVCGCVPASTLMLALPLATRALRSACSSPATKRSGHKPALHFDLHELGEDADHGRRVVRAGLRLHVRVAVVDEHVVAVGPADDSVDEVVRLPPPPPAALWNESILLDYLVK
ncbi:Os03g0432277 [Oryza sativa Japonica Group]|uniref:Os03g0432277 protein n=1 Tax=Oryza sativa subsp. japonica TaxID=39947 RepID=A0A0N7KHH4_ORYSJ|nr:Os03g0432277 [Oryza sativa Japonica Group]